MRLPEFFVKISPIGETLTAFEQEMAHLEAEAAEKNRQLTPSTADTGLALWEQDYGLPSVGDLSARRSRLRSALTGAWQTLTPEALRQLAVTVGGGGAVSIQEDFALSRVVLWGVFPDAAGLAALEEALERLKPAHLQVVVNPSTELTGSVKVYPALGGSVFAELTGTPETYM